MDNNISSQDVAKQFAKAVELFLEWLDNRLRADQPPQAIEPMSDDKMRLLTAEEEKNLD